MVRTSSQGASGETAPALWAAAVLIAQSSLLFGFCMSALNSLIKTGTDDYDTPEACYDPSGVKSDGDSANDCPTG